VAYINGLHFLKLTRFLKNVKIFIHTKKFELKLTNIIDKWSNPSNYRFYQSNSYFSNKQLKFTNLLFNDSFTIK